MSRTSRSPIRRIRSWVRERRRRVADWVERRREQLSWRIRRDRARTRRWLLRIVAPHWLRRSLTALSARVQRAQRSVIHKRHQMSQSVAHSAVGERVKKLAERSKRLESRLTNFIVEGAKFIAMLLGALVPDPVRRGLGWMGRQFWRAVNVLLVFVSRWFGTRHYWHLLGGVPAFLLALPLAYCMIRMPFYTADQKAKHYRRAAADAMEDRDYATANLYYRKLSQLGAMNEVAEYQSAINTIESGNEVDGIARMKRLAPEDEPRFAPAHLWLARWYLRADSPTDRESANALAERHLAHALDRDPGSLEARSLRALHMQRTGRWEAAATELRQVVKQLPERGLSLAEVYARQGRWDAARREVDKVLQIFMDKEAREDELDVYEYMTWSYGYRILGNLERAETVLKTGYEKFPDHKPLKEQLRSLLIGLASMQFDRRDGEPQLVMDRLLLAASLDPSDTGPLIMLANSTIDESHFGQYNRRAVQQLLDQGDAPKPLYAIVAPLIGQRGDLTQAVRHLRKAIELDPQDSYSLNNLAFCLMQLSGHEREALELVDRALRIEPDQAIYRDTRGQLLVRLGQYRESIDDLTFALNGLGDQPEIHVALATAYEQLGQPEQARLHHQQAR
jgi:tetratricopeptide (TPR) repeat protein